MKIKIFILISIIIISTLEIFTIQGNAKEIVLESDNKSIVGVRFSPDGKQVMSFTFDGLVSIWDTNTGSLVTDLKLNVFLNGADWSSDSSKVIILTKRVYNDNEYNATIITIDIDKNKTVSNLDLTQKFILTSFSIRPESNELALSWYETDKDNNPLNRISLVNFLTGEITNIITDVNNSHSLGWIENGNKLLFVDMYKNKNYLNIWDSTSQEIILTHQLISDAINGFSSKRAIFSISPNQKSLAYTYSYEKKAFLTYLTKHAIAIVEFDNMSSIIDEIRVESRISALTWKSEEELLFGTSKNDTFILNPKRVDSTKDRDIKKFTILSDGINDFDYDSNYVKFLVLNNDRNVILYDFADLKRDNVYSSNFFIVPMFLALIYLIYKRKSKKS